MCKVRWFKESLETDGWKSFLDAIASLDSVQSVSQSQSHFLKSRVWRSYSRFIMIQLYPNMMKFLLLHTIIKFKITYLKNVDCLDAVASHDFVLSVYKSIIIVDQFRWAVLSTGRKTINLWNQLRMPPPGISQNEATEAGEGSK